MADATQTFDALWEALCDLLGPPTTAALMRCAVKHTSRVIPAIAELAIEKQRFTYRYTLPAGWSAELLDSLLASLRPLLVELTGAVVLERLRAVPGLEETTLF